MPYVSIRGDCPYLCGQEIGRFQQIQAMIADMISKTEAARLLVYQLGRLKDAGVKRASMTASMAKLLASEVCFECANHAVQIHGGYGYMEEYRICRIYRDVRALSIFAGTSEIMKLIISRNLGLRS